MSEYGREFHKFVMGEIRTDGFKSGWRIEQERRRAEEMGKRQFVTAPQIVVRQKRESRPRGPQKPRAKRIERPSKWGIPSGSSPAEYGRIARKTWRDASLCGSCGQPAVKDRYSCPSCMERKAKYYCKSVKKEYVPRVVVQKFCKDCNVPLKSNNSYGYCRAHYRKRRHYLEKAA